MGAIVVLALWVLSWIAVFWVYSDASERYEYESSIGCLWALVVLALGPIAFIAYLLVRPPRRIDDTPYEPSRASRQDIRSTKHCPECHAAIAWNARYCSSCQADLSRTGPGPANREEDLLCRACGRWNEAEARYCSQCGESLR